MEVQDQDQDQPSLDHPMEDTYCILQMLLHLMLPLTEVLASSSQRSPDDTSLERVDSSTVRDVLGVLADFDPAMAFTVIQGNYNIANGGSGDYFT